jgi:hypothetical protein
MRSSPHAGARKGLPHAHAPVPNLQRGAHPQRVHCRYARPQLMRHDRCARCAQPVVASRAAEHRCTALTLACDFACVGCRHRGTGSELRQHEAREAAAHAALLRAAWARTGAAQEAAEARLAQLEAESRSAIAGAREAVHAANQAVQQAR